MRMMPGRSEISCRSVLLAALAAAWPGGSAAADTPFWLTRGKTVEACAGQSGEPFKVQGTSWGVLVSGLLTCKDAGDVFSYHIEFLNVLIDPSERQKVTRDSMEFDWCGLALYGPAAGGEGIDWIYEKALPIRGVLRRDSTKKITFGNLTFTVPKSDVKRATNMVFFVTFHGPMVAFTVL